LPEKDIIIYPGYCPIHMNITPASVLEKKSAYPQAEVLVHPECHMDVINIADYVGSTSGIMSRVANSNSNTFIIVTEIGVLERLKRDYPYKNFILGSKHAVCQNMKWNTLEDILNVLKNDNNEIHVPESTIKQAFGSISKMMELEQ